MYTREFHDGYYRAASYVISKLLTDVPSSGIGALAWSAIICAPLYVRSMSALCPLYNRSMSALWPLPASAPWPGPLS